MGSFCHSLVPMQPAPPARLPARGVGSDCAHTAWVGGLRLPPQERLGTASRLAAAGPHLTSPPESPPCVLPRAGRPAPPRSLWGSGWLWFALPLWEGAGSGGSWPPHPRLEAQSRCAAGPTGPWPAAPWAGVLSRQAGRERPAALPAGRSCPQLPRWGEQARLSGREARAGMKRPFMAAQRPSVSLGAWPLGPVVRLSVKQAYLPKGGGAGGEPTVPRPVAGSRGAHFSRPLSQHAELPVASHSGPCPPFSVLT